MLLSQICHRVGGEAGLIAIRLNSTLRDNIKITSKITIQTWPKKTKIWVNPQKTGKCHNFANKKIFIGY